MSQDTIEDRIDRLYARPLGDFTSSRNELAKELRGSGQRDLADRVKSLRKPSVTAWAVNQIVHHYPDVFDATVAATVAIRDAHAKGPAGLTDAMEVRKKAIAVAVEEAKGVLTRADHPLGPTALRRVVGTLETLSSGSADVIPGRLTTDLEPPGFGGLAGLQFAAPPGGLKPPRAKPGGQAGSAMKGGKAAGAGAKGSALAKARRADPATPAERKRKSAEEARLEKASAALERATSMLSRLELDAAAAEKDVRRAAKQLADATAASAGAKEALEQTRRRYEEAAAQEAQLASRLERLRETQVTREASAESARATVGDARERMAQLEPR